MIASVCVIAREAGAEILKHYGRVSASMKADQSPLTAADLAAHHWIVSHLTQQFPSIPVLSEESENIPWETRSRWNEFWLVDPLDGTKEFLKQSGEFTVNIALIRNGRPVLGVVYAPVLDLMYWAEAGQGAYAQKSGEAIRRLQCRVPDSQHLTFVASRDHAGPGVSELLKRFPTARTSSMGSSLKFCLVAQGDADAYLRDLPTMEWDTAAAHCLVESAGGTVTDLENRPLQYNKPDLHNPPFIALAQPGWNWR